MTNPNANLLGPGAEPTAQIDSGYVPASATNETFDFGLDNVEDGVYLLVMMCDLTQSTVALSEFAYGYTHPVAGPLAYGVTVFNNTAGAEALSTVVLVLTAAAGTDVQLIMGASGAGPTDLWRVRGYLYRLQ